jgi:hypothetical protein
VRPPCRSADGYVLGTDVALDGGDTDESGTVDVAETVLCLDVPETAEFVETVDGRTPSSVPECEDDASAAVVPPIVRAAPATANTSTLRIAAPFRSPTTKPSFP